MNVSKKLFLSAVNRVFLGACFSFLFSMNVGAQNIVIDPGLEDTLKCPFTSGRFYSAVNPSQLYISDWRSTTRSSPDLHNLCGYNNYVPHTGDGYAGIIIWDPAETREYISAMFDSPMVAGECYYVEFYVALKENCVKTIDEFQINFSPGVPVDLSWPPPSPIQLSVDYQVPAPITSQVWEKVSFLYEADGGEESMTFGNFMDNNNTTVSDVGGFGSVSAYYYIDDVTVTALDIGTDLSFCEGDSVQVLSNISCPLLTYLWSNGDQDSTTFATDNGLLSLEISGAGQCTMMDTIQVSVAQGGSIDAGSDVTINQGQSATLSASGSTNPTWAPPVDLSCLNCISTTASPLSTQTYVVSGLDVGGCMGQDSVTVFVIAVNDTTVNDDSAEEEEEEEVIEDSPQDDSEEIEESGEPEEVYIYVPNAFTPNGDGDNDVFTAFGGPFNTYNLTIWNRWGELVYETSSPEDGWTGIGSDGNIQDGIYTYIIRVDIDPVGVRELSGHVTLVK